MLPLYKVLSIFIRVFSKPLVNYTKQLDIHKHPGMKFFFVWLGNFYHRMDQAINRRFLKLQNKDYVVKKLNDELALLKGIQFFYQLFLYAILITIPLAELYKADIDNKEKAKLQKQKEEQLNNELKQAQNKMTELSKQIQMLKRQQQLQVKMLQSISTSKRLYRLDLLP